MAASKTGARVASDDVGGFFERYPRWLCRDPLEPCGIFVRIHHARHTRYSHYNKLTYVSCSQCVIHVPKTKLTLATAPIERWRLPNLRVCQSLRFLNVPLLTISILKDTEEGDRAGSEWLSTYYEYSIGAITEIVLSSPLQLSAVGLLFIHAGDPYDTRVTERLDQVSCWERLDDAVVGLPGVEEVACFISKDPGRVLERAAETVIRHGTTVKFPAPTWSRMILPFS